MIKMASSSLDTVSLSKILDELSSDNDTPVHSSRGAGSATTSKSAASLDSSWSSGSFSDTPTTQRAPSRGHSGSRASHLRTSSVSSSSSSSSLADLGTPGSHLQSSGHKQGTHGNPLSGTSPGSPAKIGAQSTHPDLSVTRAPSPDRFSTPFVSPRELQSPSGCVTSSDPPFSPFSEFPPPTAPIDRSAASASLCGPEAAQTRINTAASAKELEDRKDTEEDDSSSSADSSSSDSDSECPDSESHPEAPVKSVTKTPLTSPRSVIHSPLPAPPVPASPTIQAMSPISATSPKPKGKESLKINLMALSPPPDDNRSPSPLFGRRSPRGALGWRPVMPGYHPPKNDNQRLMFDGRGGAEGRPRGTDMSLKDYIPVMSKPLAIVCLILNVISPGLGTLLSGVSVACCSTARPKGTDRLHCLWVNTWVSVLQLLTTCLVLLGWIWSIMWGVAFLSIANKLEEDLDVDAVQTISSRPGSAFSGSLNPAMSQHGEMTDRPSQPFPAGAYGRPDARHVPMITLQDTPLVLGNNATFGQNDPYSRGSQTQRSLNSLNPRHQRALRRHDDDILPSYLLNGQALENIVIRNAPVPDQMIFGRHEPPQPPALEHSGSVPKGFSNSDLEALEQELDAGLGPSSSYAQPSSSSQQHRGQAQGQRSNRHRAPSRQDSQQHLL